ncbi:MAG: hypothetical protein CBD27_01820 [Rhodospirillaceae bacterium TMED167]|nr:oxidoreductase [Rhodospirillaceae bacterium]OUW30307.1 MAG: hypothetical protein CBD27_01820 [Rhodospirillaceae bacterium TMED167]
MINAAIVGIGNWGQLLVTSVRNSESIKFTKGSTRTKSKAAEFCNTNGIELVDDYDGLLADPSIDAIVLATPHTQHVSQVIAAAEAGKHVFAEKPYTLSKSDTETALMAVKKAGVKTAVGLNRRFAPNFQKLKTMIQDGTLGAPIQIEGHFSANLALKDAWRSDPSESPAGGMTSLGIHIVDAFINMFGPVSEVRAYSKSLVTSYNIDDTTRILFEFANGRTGYFGSVTGTSTLTYLRVFGTGGWASVNNANELTFAPLGGQPETENWDGYLHPALKTIGAGLEAFAADIEGGASFLVSPDQILHGVAVLDAIFRSIDSGNAEVP